VPIKIAVLTETDAVWHLPAWNRTLRHLRSDGFEVIGIWECPAILTKLRGPQIPLWYLRTFGLLDFMKLATFAAWVRIKYRGPKSFRSLADDLGIEHHECASPNSAPYIDWCRQNKIDLSLATVSFILKPGTLSAPRLGTVNKHAAALPANKGLFPYIWATIYGGPQGVSYHLMAPAIDEGPLLVQDLDIPAEAARSMISFYVHAFEKFPAMMLAAVAAAINATEVKSPAMPSYHGLPSRSDMKQFRAKGGRIIAASDFSKIKGLLDVS
jgi:hypothetical protein